MIMNFLKPICVRFSVNAKIYCIYFLFFYDWRGILRLLSKEIDVGNCAEINGCEVPLIKP